MFLFDDHELSGFEQSMLRVKAFDCLIDIMYNACVCSTTPEQYVRSTAERYPDYLSLYERLSRAIDDCSNTSELESALGAGYSVAMKYVREMPCSSLLDQVGSQSERLEPDFTPPSHFEPEIDHQYRFRQMIKECVREVLIEQSEADVPTD